MNYTLYIDESGDFESHRGQWIISGVLFNEKYEICEQELKNIFSSLPTEIGLNSIRDFHLTEFRRNHTHEKAVEMAKQTLSKLEATTFSYYFLTTINHTKISMSSREKTYRLMLADLLALCETVLNEDDVINHLDLVVATRTIEGVLQTNVSNIKDDIINSLPIAFEVDLATRGMVDLIGKHISVKMEYANNSWGLVCADFIANLTYHNRKNIEKEYFEEMRQKNKYFSFESFGDYESRKANIASRDGDYVLALYRWIKILGTKPDNEVAIEQIQKNICNLLTKKGTTGSYISFEDLLERFWRSYNQPSKYHELASLLHTLEKQLEIYFADKNNGFEQYLFRLRNLMIIVENHLGSTDNALKLANKQKDFLSKLAANPEYFDLILNFKSIEIEVYVNALELEHALKLANEYSKTVNTFRDVWELMTEGVVDDFGKSRAYIKSEMIRFRMELLNNNHEIDMNDFEKNITSKHDMSRLFNYKILKLLKENNHAKAATCYLELFEKNQNIQLSIFDFFWFLKSVNDGLMHNTTADIEATNTLIANHLSIYKSETIGHPVDLIYREMALYEFLRGDKSKALKFIKKSKTAFNLGSSNIASWLKIVLEIHEDYFKGKLKSEQEYFSELQNFSFLGQIANSNKPLIIKVRYFTPY